MQFYRHYCSPHKMSKSVQTWAEKGKPHFLSWTNHAAAILPGSLLEGLVCPAQTYYILTHSCVIPVRGQVQETLTVDCFLSPFWNHKFLKGLYAIYYTTQHLAPDWASLLGRVDSGGQVGGSWGTVWHQVGPLSIGWLLMRQTGAHISLATGGLVILTVLSWGEGVLALAVLIIAPGICSDTSTRHGAKLYT